jgi:hypothetical protein
MTRTWHITVALVLLLMGLAWPSLAQEPAAPAEPAPSGFDVHGSVDVGYRFTDVDGSAATYRQLFDLSDGGRVMGIDVRGDAREGGNAFADDFTFSASGFGDPFPTMQLTARKTRVYDVRIAWRKSRFFNAAPLTPPSIGGVDTRAVTDRHGWETSRQTGNVALKLDATARLHFLFSFDRVARDGALETTRSVDFVGSPSTWGAFARANPYPVVGPLDDTSNRIAGGGSYAGDRWSLHYRAGYQTIDESQTLDVAASPERSINVADAATAGELLSSHGATQSRRLTGPFSEASYVVEPARNLEWRGQYVYSRYEGLVALDGAAQGVARTNNAGTALSPFALGIRARGDLKAPSHVVTQRLIYRPFERWAFDVAYRYSRFRSETAGEVSSLLTLYPTATSGPAAAAEAESATWLMSAHSVDLGATFEPNRTLTVRPGVIVSRRDVEHLAHGVTAPATSEVENVVSPTLLVGYRPISSFSARGSWSMAHSDESYTRLSPVDRTNGRVVVRFEPRAGLVLEGTASLRDAELPAAAFVSHTRLGSLQVSYSFSELFTVHGGLDYQTFLALGSVSFLRGVAPIVDDAMRYREVDRVWQLGGVAKPTSRLGISVTAHLNRTTGTDAIAGEPPLYGPLTFPYATGTIYYDVSGAGRFSVDLTRTHYYQDVLPLNDFRASLVTIRFSRSF